jgi:hypothetical protein
MNPQKCHVFWVAIAKFWKKLKFEFFFLARFYIKFLKR